VEYIKKLEAPLKEIIEDRKQEITTFQLRQNMENVRKSLEQYTGNISYFKEIQNFLDFYLQAILMGIFIGWIHHREQKCSPEDFDLSNLVKIFPPSSVFYLIFSQLPNAYPENITKNIFIPIKKIFQSINVKENGPLDYSLSTFYSDMLGFYDPKTKDAMGVVYTPDPIVEFMLRGIDYILHNKFDQKSGILTNKARFLDPAAGTLAFSCGLLRIAYEKAFQHSDELNFKEWFINQFCRQIYAFEVLYSPFLMGQMYLLLTANRLGLNNESIGHFNKFYLVNTLLLDHRKGNPELNKMHKSKRITQAQDPGYDLSALWDQIPGIIDVVMGNPPYNVSPQNNAPWIQQLIEDYKENLEESNLKILSDDYVKFFRFAQWKIQQNGRGIVAFITNNNYLDGAVFSSMRRSLMHTFNEIYVVNLHGNLRKGEKGNPFNITVGVSIVFLIRTQDTYKPQISKEEWEERIDRVVKTYRQQCADKKCWRLSNEDFNQLLSELDFGCHVYYWDLPHSTVEDKYAQFGVSFDPSHFSRVPPNPYFYFIPKDVQFDILFRSYPSITDLFIEAPRSGIMSGRDNLTSNNDPELLRENIRWLFSRNFNELQRRGISLAPTKSWNIEKILTTGNENHALNSIIKYHYYGLDVRYVIYEKGFVEGRREGYLDLISADNPAISVTRSIRTEQFSHVLMTKYPVEKCFLAVKDSSYVFLQKTKKEGSWQNNVRIPHLHYNATAKEVFYYIYGVLHAISYRFKYGDQLRRHFPHIPFPDSNSPKKDQELFAAMSHLGWELGNCHMQIDSPNKTAKFGFSDTVDIKITRFKYLPEDQCIEIFRADYPQKPIKVTKIDQAMWDYEIGSVRQLEQWLESRRYVDPEDFSKKRHLGLRRALSAVEINDFIALCITIKRTLEILPEIDRIYRQIDIL
jgi:hypothetical protein